jgi:hypothetical protein
MGGSWNSKLDLLEVLAAVGSPSRWPTIELLADGRERIATEVAQELGRDFDAVAKHLRVLRDVGVALARDGEDRRLTFFYIPSCYRPEPGVLDFGCCVIYVDGRLRMPTSARWSPDHSFDI